MPELVQWLYEIGPIVQGGMGPVPIGWQDIAAWQSVTGLVLAPHEAQAIRTLSMAYADQHHRSKDANCPCPWADPTQVDREAVADKVSEQFRAFSQRRKNNGRRRKAAG